MLHFSVVILAAGGSSRLGQPKQLVRLGNKSLLRIAAETAVNSKPKKTFVVLGANRTECRKELVGLPIEVVENEDWSSGLASSLKAGLMAVDQKLPAVVMLCDQPFVSSLHLRDLVKALEDSQYPVASSTYSKSKGVPAAFAPAAFAQLLEKEGDSGAKAFIKAHPEAPSIPFERASYDVDTEQDLRRLLNAQVFAEEG